MDDIFATDAVDGVVAAETAEIIAGSIAVEVSGPFVAIVTSSNFPARVRHRYRQIPGHARNECIHHRAGLSYSSDSCHRHLCWRWWPSPSPGALSSRLQHEVAGGKCVPPDKLDLEVRDAVAVGVAFNMWWRPPNGRRSSNATAPPHRRRSSVSMKLNALLPEARLAACAHRWPRDRCGRGPLEVRDEIAARRRVPSVSSQGLEDVQRGST